LAAPFGRFIAAVAPSCRQLLPPLTCGEYCPPTILFFCFLFSFFFLAGHRYYYVYITKEFFGRALRNALLMGNRPTMAGGKGARHTQYRETGDWTTAATSPGVEFICRELQNGPRDKKKKKKSQKTHRHL
jgi:hypothetical protein